MERATSSGFTEMAQEGRISVLSRKEKRKGRKKVKRSAKRQHAAEHARHEEEIRSQDPLVREQAAREAEQERIEHDIQETLWFQREKEAQEETNRKRREAEAAAEEDESAWDYVEEGPAEIIWEGNEIIVRKQKVKVPKSQLKVVEAAEDDQPDSNPLLPESLYHKATSSSLPSQSSAYEDHKKLAHTTIFNGENNPNFGTEQDKTHCPFHIKTGVCRFGVNCSRAHVYPDKSCTLLIKNMYHGPGLPMEHDEGLEYTDEEVVQSYKEFFEDVHGEFLKYGEIVNFKVCRNESSHLRGNVYAQFQSVEAAVTAYHALNGRFYAGKQITCHFVVVPRWRAALCGEYMRSRHRVCSHGTACNFLHCFKNPRGLYEWSDWDSSRLHSCTVNGRRGRGYSSEQTAHREREKYGHSRSHKENTTGRKKGSNESRGKHRSRQTNHHGRSSSDDSVPEKKFRSREKRYHKRCQDRYGRSSSEESMAVENRLSRKKRLHRNSNSPHRHYRRSSSGDLSQERSQSKKKQDKIAERGRVEDCRTESRSSTHKPRRSSRSQNSKNSGCKESINDTRDITPRWRGRSRSHESSERAGVRGDSSPQWRERNRSVESSESVISSDRGSVSKKRSKRHRSKRGRDGITNRYRAQGALLPKSLQQGEAGQEVAPVMSTGEGMMIYEPGKSTSYALL